MIWRPPTSTLTDTLFPYPTRCRSGVELDVSAPLTAFGLPDTGLFANYTYLDSETTDPFTGEKRRFNNQPHHVYNAGFIQNVPSIDESFGASVSGRSAALESNRTEERRVGKECVRTGRSRWAPNN